MGDSADYGPWSTVTAATGRRTAHEWAVARSSRCSWAPPRPPSFPPSKLASQSSATPSPGYPIHQCSPEQGSPPNNSARLVFSRIFYTPAAVILFVPVFVASSDLVAIRRTNGVASGDGVVICVASRLSAWPTVYCARSPHSQPFIGIPPRIADT